MLYSLSLQKFLGASDLPVSRGISVIQVACRLVVKVAIVGSELKIKNIF